MIEKKEGICFKHNSDCCGEDQIVSPVKIQVRQVKEEHEKNEKLRRYAFVVCLLTVLINLFMAVAAFVCAAVTGSSAGYAFALDCVLDMLSASLLLWRYYGSNSTYAENKEKITCISLGVLFILSALGILGKSIYDVIMHSVPRQLMYIFILAGIGTLVGPVLGVFKYILHKRLNSKSLFLDALNSFLSGVLAFMITVGDLLYYHINAAWCLDPVMSMVVAVILICSGIRVIVKRNSPEEKPHTKDKGEREPLLP